jgi:nucleoid-associated protein YgaU
MMSAASIVRIALPFVAIVTGCAVALVSDVTHVRREATPASSASTTASTSPQLVASSARNKDALAAADTQAAAVAEALAVSPRPTAAAEAVPAFDIARIEPTGEAVIAGRAAPGATVELLGKGERLDRAVAGASGQFAMVVSRLPPGSYELTLSARSPDGTLATSRQGVPVALEETPSSFGAIVLRAEAPPDPAAAAKTKRLSQDVKSSQARLMSGPVQVAGREAESQPRHALAAASALDRPSSSSASLARAPQTLTRIVSRGDSLWQISRLAYGAGEQYIALYKANRDRIQNPNLIYPGQTFVIPRKGH